MATFESPLQSGERLLLRFGAVAAFVGTALQVAAGSSQAGQMESAADVTLSSLAEQPDWAWPLIYFGFMFGALLWVLALVVLTSTLRGRAAPAWGRLAVAAVIVGAALHVVDASLNAGPLNDLARDWSTAGEAERATLAQHADLLIRLLDGTWAGVITLFHGVPFLLAGWAVVAEPDHPSWLGGIGILGGAGSVVVGILMFLRVVGPGLAVPFAVVISIFMVVIGGRLWARADRARMASLGPAEPR